MKALNNALKQGTGMSLMDFQVAGKAVIRAAKTAEARVLHPEFQVFVLVDTIAGTWTMELPLEPCSWPLLTLHIDECTVGQAAMWFATLKQDLLCFSAGDCYHRDWNDIKLAFKRSYCFWKVLIQMCYVVLLPYGPWKSSDYHVLRQEMLDHMLTNSTVDADWFQCQMDLFAFDLGLDTPSDQPSQQQLFQKLATAASIRSKGPCAKMMRWFSFFEALAWQLPDIHLTRQVYKYYSEVPLATAKLLYEFVNAQPMVCARLSHFVYTV